MTMIMTLASRDQLRWQLSPDLYLCLDSDESIVVEAVGVRVAVPHPTTMIEAVRQAQAAQIGHVRPDLTDFGVRAALLKLAQDVADLADTEPLDLEEASDERSALAADARQILGLPPVPEVLEPLPPHGGPR